MPDNSSTTDFRWSDDWIADCQLWRRKVLTGRFAHWCFEWDGLPIDETTDEWPCGCGREADDPLPEFVAHG
jgi:hypothetical protein